MNGADRFVLDSFALLAYFQNEAGANDVRKVLAHGARHADSVWLSLINLGEILYIVERERGLESAHRTLALIEAMPVRLAEAGRERVFSAAHIKAQHAVSYAGAFTVALAMEKHAALVTGDPEFRVLIGRVRIQWLSR